MAEAMALVRLHGRGKVDRLVVPSCVRAGGRFGLRAYAALALPPYRQSPHTGRATASCIGTELPLVMRRRVRPVLDGAVTGV